MCNEYQLKRPLSEVMAAFAAQGEGAALPDGAPNLAPLPSIRIGDRAPVIVSEGEGAALRLLPWAWASPQGRPVFNFRSEGRSFAASARCLLPADGFFEFTAAEPGQSRKTKWRFTLAGETLFWIAGLVKQDAFSLLTTAPGADMAPYHDRQIVVLRPDQALDWLDLRRPEAALLKALPAGSLEVEKVFPSG